MRKDWPVKGQTIAFRGLSMPRKTTVAFRRGSSLRPVAKVGVALFRIK